MLRPSRSIFDWLAQEVAENLGYPYPQISRTKGQKTNAFKHEHAIDLKPN